jgi:hypothetical protein
MLEAKVYDSDLHPFFYHNNNMEDKYLDIYIILVGLKEFNIYLFQIKSLVSYMAENNSF